jgi:hypothetical protein
MPRGRITHGESSGESRHGFDSEFRDVAEQATLGPHRDCFLDSAALVTIGLLYDIYSRYWR